jgi:2-amino-4-hydroxy-6-hydroxymethyldihydropteridine diphosphokinase
LKLPRPDLLRRAYMLGPLAELAPQVRHPSAGLTIGELWSRFDRDAHPLERLPPHR